MLNLYNNVNLKNHLQYLSGQKHGLIRLETLLKYLLSNLPICGVQSLHNFLKNFRGVFSVHLEYKIS